MSETSVPLSQYSPDVGVSRQPITFISVDLPEPDGPMMATYSLRRDGDVHAAEGADDLAAHVVVALDAARDDDPLAVRSASGLGDDGYALGGGSDRCFRDLLAHRDPV